MKMMRLRLLVGKIEDEDGLVIAASVDESIYEVAGIDAWDVAAIKGTWPDEYVWREMIARIPVELVEKHFEVPEIVGLPESETPPDVIAREVAQIFHETYERLAPEFGYATREASAVPWDEVPLQNRQLMEATVDEVLERIKGGLR